LENINILIISPFSPKWSNIASLRWERLAKYLSKNNRVTLITSSFPESGFEKSFDIGNSYLIEIPLKFYAKNPYLNESNRILNNFPNKKTLLNQGLKSKLNPILEKLFPVSSGGMLYHDIFKYKNFIDEIIRNSKKTILITTYGPWFTLKIGNYFKKRYKNLIWLADFRDPSFDISSYKNTFFKSQTKKILKKADAIIVVTKQMQKEYEKLVKKKVIFLPNGYDGDCMFNLNQHKTKRKEYLNISYTGSIYNEKGEISYFVEALKLSKEKAPNINFTFSYAGKDYRIVSEEFSKRNLGSLLNNHGMLTRDEALNLQSVSDVLLLVVYTGENPEEGKSIRPGKVYEYLATDKPILVIGPKNWEMRDEIECDGVSKVFEKNQTNEMADYIIELANKEKIEINIQKRKEVLERYLYRNLATELEKEIENLLKQKEW